MYEYNGDSQDSGRGSSTSSVSSIYDMSPCSSNSTLYDTDLFNSSKINFDTLDQNNSLVHKTNKQVIEEDITLMLPNSQFIQNLKNLATVTFSKNVSFETNPHNNGYIVVGSDEPDTFPISTGSDWSSNTDNNFDCGLSCMDRNTYSMVSSYLFQPPRVQSMPSTSTFAMSDNFNLAMLPFMRNSISHNNIVPRSPIGRMLQNSMNMFPVSFHTRRNYSRIRRPVMVFGREGSGDFDLCRPWGVCCDNNGHIIIADRSNNRIQIFRLDGSHVRCFGRQGTDNGEFNRPAGVAIDYYNRIVVTDKDNHRVQVFTMMGEFVFGFGERGQSNGKFHYPWDVAVSSNGLIAISDTRNHRIQIFNGCGQFLKKFGFENASNMWKYFDSPRGLCFTSPNTIIVTDFNNHRLYEIAIDGQPRLLNSENYRRCELFRPQGIAMDSERNILVADCRNNRIQVFNRAGDTIGSFGVAGKEFGQFDRPSGIALTHDGKIVVVDFGNHRIQIF
ncbi:hypothetical protein PGB90_001114 [Kerria lacca]